MAFSVCSLAAARTCRSGPEGRQAHGCPSAAQPLTPCCRPPSGRRCLAVRARDLGRTSELSLKNQAKNEQVEIQDKLIAVFQSRKQSEWKKIIGFSKQWQSLADGVFKRCASALWRGSFGNANSWTAAKRAHSRVRCEDVYTGTTCGVGLADVLAWTQHSTDTALRVVHARRHRAPPLQGPECYFCGACQPTSQEASTATRRLIRRTGTYSMHTAGASQLQHTSTRTPQLQWLSTVWSSPEHLATLLPRCGMTVSWCAVMPAAGHAAGTILG